MAKYSNLDVLGNIKVNGVIYTEKSNVKPAIKYNSELSSWVYTNDNKSWHKFSDNEPEISYVESIPNIDKPKEKTLYITKNGEVQYFISGYFINLSYEVITDLSTGKISNEQLPRCIGCKNIY